MRLHPSAVGSIAVALHARGDQGFHWSLIVPTSVNRATQFHAAQFRDHMWGYTASILNLDGSMSLALILFIGHLGNRTKEMLDEILNTIPIPQPFTHATQAFTSQMWIAEAIRALIFHRFIVCPNPADLLNEIANYANPIHNGIITGTVQPVVVRSNYSY